MALFLVLVTFIFIAAALVWYLLRGDHGEKEPISALWVAFGLGIVGAVIAGIAESYLAASRGLSATAPAHLILSSAITIGIIEEACKFIPLAVFIYPKRYFNEHTDGVIYFAIAGLGFGLPENILYTVQFGAKTGFGRLLLTPLFHATTTALVGYVLIRVKLDKKPKWHVAVALLLVMAIHAMYDFGLTFGSVYYEGLSICITLGMVALLFILFWKAQNLDEQAGLSSVGHNSYCRSCGHANPNHYLYCVACGQRA